MDVSIGQLSHSKVEEGVVKAWHGHVYQSQWNYVVNGKISVVLFDDRENSITYKETIEFLAGDGIEKPIAYFFPPGVLHGYKCIKGPMHIIYTTSGVYDLKDEIRKSNDDRYFVVYNKSTGKVLKSINYTPADFSELLS